MVFLRRVAKKKKVVDKMKKNLALALISFSARGNAKSIKKKFYYEQ